MNKHFKLICACSVLFISYLPHVSADEWRWCANEDEVCRFDGRAEVRYGAGRHWATRSVSDNIRCNNINFGDPAPNTVKACYVRSDSNASGSHVPSGWRHCANEGEFCDFRGRAEVHYGANGRWETRSSRNGIFCGNETFGDPAPDRVKACFISSSNSDNESSNNDSGNHEWRRCAYENGFCEFDGWREIRYGTDGRWTYLTRNDGTNCSNDVFGDPAPNREKACFIRLRGN